MARRSAAPEVLREPFAVRQSTQVAGPDLDFSDSGEADGLRGRRAGCCTLVEHFRTSLGWGAHAFVSVGPMRASERPALHLELAISDRDHAHHCLPSVPTSPCAPACQRASSPVSLLGGGGGAGVALLDGAPLPPVTRSASSRIHWNTPSPGMAPLNSDNDHT